MNVSILPIGGYRRLIANMTAIIGDKSIYLIDAGKGFQDAPTKIRRLSPQIISRQQPILPNFSLLDPYLLNGYKIKGLFLTHVHGDHVGGLQDFWTFLQERAQTDIVLYSSQITARLTRAIAGSKYFPQALCYTLKDRESFKTPEGYQVTTICLNHSVLGTTGLHFNFGDTTLLYVPDFCFDYSPGIGVDQLKIDETLRKIGNRGVDYMICEGTVASSDFSTLPVSEGEISEKIKSTMGYYQDREGLIVSGYGTNPVRIKTVIQKSVDMGRQVLIIGKNLSRLTQEYFKMGLIRIECKPKVTRVRDLNTAVKNKRKYTILTTGHQGEYLAGLPKMLRGELNWPWTSNDVVIILSRTIPRINCQVSRSWMLHELTARRVTVEDAIHKSGHVSGLGLTKLLTMVKPLKRVLVNHGDEEEMVGWYKVASLAKYPLEKIQIGTNGRVITL